LNWTSIVCHSYVKLFPHFSYSVVNVLYLSGSQRPSFVFKLIVVWGK